MSSGVPQGTVLGPLLFLVYINDMPSHISSGTSLKPFADDAMLYRQINNHTDQDNLHNDLDRLTDWEKTWQMTFNPSKCEIMHITRSKSPIHNSYTVRDEPLRAVPVATHLGIDISSNLSYNPHINKIANKSKRNLQSIPQPIKKYAYRILVRPHLEYCCPLWDPYTIRNINHLEGSSTGQQDSWPIITAGRRPDPPWPLFSPCQP